MDLPSKRYGGSVRSRGLTLLVHLGYLTFDEDTEEVFIPDQEIMQEFLNVVDDPVRGGLMDALKRSEELLKSIPAS